MSGGCFSPLDNIRVESDRASLWVTLAGRENQSIAAALSFILGRRGPGSWSRRLLATAIYNLWLLNGRNLWAGACCSRSLEVHFDTNSSFVNAVYYRWSQQFLSHYLWWNPSKLEFTVWSSRYSQDMLKSLNRCGLKDKKQAPSQSFEYSATDSLFFGLFVLNSLLIVVMMVMIPITSSSF